MFCGTLIVGTYVIPMQVILFSASTQCTVSRLHFHVHAHVWSEGGNTNEFELRAREKELYKQNRFTADDLCVSAFKLGQKFKLALH